MIDDLASTDSGKGAELVAGIIRVKSLDDFAVGDGATNDSSALADAIASLPDGGTLALNNKTYLVDPSVTIPYGVNIVGPGVLKLSGQASNFLIPKGNNRFRDFDIQGSGIGDGSSGVALIAIIGSGGDRISDIWIDNVNGYDGLGDGIRFEDCENVFVKNSNWDVSRNPYTINDTSVGSRHIYIDGFRCSCKIIGFGAESDDNTCIVEHIYLSNGYIVNIQTSPPSTTYGVGFTKSTTLNAGTFKKYRDFHVTNVTVDNFYFAAQVRGADGGSYYGFRAKNCDRGIEIANGNEVWNLTVDSPDISADSNGFVTAGATKNLTLSGGTFNLVSGAGVFVDGAENVSINGPRILYSDGTSSTGLRVTDSSGIVENAYIEKALTALINVSAASGKILEVKGNTGDTGGSTVAAGLVFSGSTAGLSVHDNHLLGTITKVIDDNSNGLFRLENNEGADLFVGQAKTTSSGSVTATFSVRGTDLAYIPIESGVFAGFEIIVKGFRTSSSTPGGIYARLDGAIKNTGGTTALVGSVTSSPYFETDSSMSITVTADDTNDGIKVEITGVDSQTHTFNIVCRLHYIRT